MAKYSHMEAVSRAAGFYRANPHRFVKDFLHIDLRWFQKLIIYAMSMNPVFAMVAARGIGKTFIIAVFCCVQAVLYPGSQICIASGTRGQAIQVLEKIKTIILPKSQELRCEIKGDISTKPQDAAAYFHNGSFIKVVTASDAARGNRANLLIIDEFRLVDKDTIDTVLTKFLNAMRQPGYLTKPKYKDYDNGERNRQVYLSSAYTQDHWSYGKAKSVLNNMMNPDLDWFICSFPYQLGIKEKLTKKEDVADQMLDDDFNEIKWSMEMLSVFWGESDGAFFNYESIAKNRKIKYPMLPNSVCEKIKDSDVLRIPQKQHGELRLLSADIALMSSKRHKNDASSIFITQLLPTKAGRYIMNVVYTDAAEGLRTDEQALMIRKLFDEYTCDYLILDCKGLGIGVLDALESDIVDSESGEIYPAISCCNNAELADRCTNKNAEKVIWAINASAKFNSDCAVLLREGFKSGKIRLLTSEVDGEKALMDLKGYSGLSIKEKIKYFQKPYIHTTLLIAELINLQHEEINGLVKIFEKSGMRKDRYSSLSYNYYVACQLEKDIRRRSRDRSSQTTTFYFRPPKIRPSKY